VARSLKSRGEDFIEMEEFHTVRRSLKRDAEVFSNFIFWIIPERGVWLRKLSLGSLPEETIGLHRQVPHFFSEDTSIFQAISINIHRVKLF